MVGYAIVEGHRIFTFDKELKKYLTRGEKNWNQTMFIAKVVGSMVSTQKRKIEWITLKN